MIDTYVYFIQASNAIKIGIASDVERRIVDLQVGNPHRIELIHAAQILKQDALAIESKIHHVFRKTRLTGEWFQANQYMLDFISNIEKNGLESYPNWLSKQYEDTYTKILQPLEKQLDLDAAVGNMVSLDKLRASLEELLGKSLAVAQSPTNTHQSVREWLKGREPGSFTLKDVCSDFGIGTRVFRKNVTVILSRLSEEGLISKTDSYGVFKVS